VQPIGAAGRANDDFAELLFWMDAFKRSGAKYVTAVVPYFSYAKGDKKDEPRVSIRARVVAESIELAGADRIVAMDLHAPQIQGFFKRPVDHLLGRPLLAAYVRSLGLEDLVVVAPDAGYAKNARKFAACLGLPVAIADKDRSCHDECAEILEVMGSVKDMNALIVDDFSISGGTIAELAAALRRRGARRVYACLTHLPLSEAGAARIEASDIEYVIATDTVPQRRPLSPDRFKILSAGPIFAEAVRRMQERRAIGDLMDELPPGMLEASIG
jgi:ribose-phosphate pyrophosphokinase